MSQLKLVAQCNPGFVSMPHSLPLKAHTWRNMDYVMEVVRDSEMSILGWLDYGQFATFLDFFAWELTHIW
jgi:hypothetical protein